MFYKTPGSYAEREKTVRTANDLPSTSVGGVIGETVRGIPNKAIRITSWPDFVSQFALGEQDPFIVGNVADAVYGFFNNGGKEIYVVRALESGTKAQAVIPSESGVTFTAKEEGTWGNDLSLEVKEETIGSSTTFTLVVSYKNTKVEEIKKLTQENFLETINSNSQYVTVQGEQDLAVGTGKLTNGTQTASKSATFVKALNCFDVIEDINMLAITGIVEEGVQEKLAEYCDKRGTIFPVLDVPSTLTTIDEVMEYKDKFSTFLGAVYFPRVQIQNPVTMKKKFVYPSGHLMGVFARTDSTRGIHKAPAGLESTIRGAIDVEVDLSHTEIGLLNDYEVNCIVPKKNHGIVVWGARLLRADDDRVYVSDMRLDIFVEQAVLKNTEWAVFEPKDSKLFNSLTSQVTGMMMDFWNRGMFLGDTMEDAFFVRCDKDLNPDVNSSEVVVEIGYAKKKPAEFIINRISNKGQ